MSTDYNLRWHDPDSSYSGTWQIEANGGWPDLSGYWFGQPTTNTCTVTATNPPTYEVYYVVASQSLQPGTNGSPPPGANPPVGDLIAAGGAGESQDTFTLSMPVISYSGAPYSYHYIQAAYLISDDPTFKVKWSKTNGLTMINQTDANLQWVYDTDKSKWKWQWQDDGGRWVDLPPNGVLTNTVPPGTAPQLTITNGDRENTDIAAIYQGATIEQYAYINSGGNQLFTLTDSPPTEDHDFITWNTQLWRPMNGWQVFNVSG